MRWDRSATRVGRDQRGRPARSDVARKVAVPRSAMTAPRAQASSKTTVGSRTSFRPSPHADMASPRLSICCTSTSARLTSHPAADAQMSAVMESLCDKMETRESGGRAEACMACTFAAPSTIIPPNVTATMVPNGTRALTGRSRVPGLGSSGPPAVSTTTSEALGCGVARGRRGAVDLNSGRERGPMSLPEKTVMGTSASMKRGKKRYLTDASTVRKGSSVSPTVWSTEAT
mmetsp:Transcript_11177/g.37048  ORF Transcript_11177/g.37048 Transcript_11177/m.37048 type:complete len:231 (-) Transcript_11177:727-1419(-)